MDRNIALIETVVPSNWKLTSLAHAQEMAKACTERLGFTCLGVDDGPNISPRYKVITQPQVGDQVSYAFNGDYYPDGEIASISTSLRVITTSTGKRYYRRGQSNHWIQTGGTWSLIHGHHDERNPHI